MRRFLRQRLTDKFWSSPSSIILALCIMACWRKRILNAYRQRKARSATIFQFSGIDRAISRKPIKSGGWALFLLLFAVRLGKNLPTIMTTGAGLLPVSFCAESCTLDWSVFQTDVQDSQREPGKRICTFIGTGHLAVKSEMPMARGRKRDLLRHGIYDDRI